MPNLLHLPTELSRQKAALLDASTNEAAAPIAQTVNVASELENQFPLLEKALFVILFSTSLSIFLFTTILKLKGRTDDQQKKIPPQFKSETSYVNNLPGVGVIEALTFVWVLGCLGLSTYYLFYTFNDNALRIFNGSSEISAGDTLVLFFLSFVCGLLGGSLANLKYFLPATNTSKDINRFDLRYVYRYLANPFFSSIIAFFAFLLMVNFKLIGFEKIGMDAARAGNIDKLSFIFVFVLVGYFSEVFMSLLYVLVKKVRAMFEKIAENIPTSPIAS
jgi:hypothetical protein